MRKVKNAGRPAIKAIASLAGLALLAGASASGAQVAPRPDAQAFQRAQAEFNKVPNTPGDGPFPATMEADPGFPAM